MREERGEEGRGREERGGERRPGHPLSRLKVLGRSSDSSHLPALSDLGSQGTFLFSVFSASLEILLSRTQILMLWLLADIPKVNSQSKCLVTATVPCESEHLPMGSCSACLAPRQPLT